MINPFIISKPMVTERSLELANTNNIFTFEVDLRANKHQIAAAVESLYGVKVEKVRTHTKQKKVKRTGRRRLPKLMPKQKKAFVTLKEGDNIDLFDLGGK